MQTLATFARFVPLPENRSALIAFQQLAFILQSDEPELTANPLYLHGPSGTGKSCLVAALIAELGRHAPACTSCVLSANDFPLPWDQDQVGAGAERYQTACECGLLVVEDLQHLPTRTADTLTTLLDYRLQHDLAIVFTASTGPTQLQHRGNPFPARLTNRLGQGLTVSLQPLQTASRMALIRELASRRGLPIADDILSWLGESLTGGGRQLEGAIHRIDALTELHGGPITIDALREHFEAQVDAGRPTVERIVRRVSEYYRVEARQLRSARRHQSLMLPRQVSMYLARRLTPLSLQQIGNCFGGRDHSTVLHACRKVEEAIAQDATLNGAVSQMQSELA